MLYFQVWWIHGFQLMRQTIMPALGLGKIEKKSEFDLWLHRIYAAMTPIVYLIYVQYIPVGYNYATLALLLQVGGRFIVAENVLKLDWMQLIEAPGVVAVFFFSFG